MSDFTSLEPILHNYTRNDTIDEGSEGIDQSDQAIVDIVIQYDCRDGWLPYIILPNITLHQSSTLVEPEEQEMQYYRSLAWFKARRQIVQ